MAQRKLLFIDTDGVPLEHNSVSDEVTMKGFTAQEYFEVVDPTTGWLNQTAGDLIFDNIMGKDRDNVMTSGSGVLFGAISDTGAQVDSLQVPRLTTAPTATPAANTNQGFIVAYNGSLWMWDGTTWVDLGASGTASSIQNTYTAGVALAATDAVYISAADTVEKALADNTSKSHLMGFASTSALLAAQVPVASEGVLSGFSGLTAGARYYLSPTTAGAITSTVPTGSGKTVVQAGYAKSATALHIHIEQMGRRA